MQRNSSKTLSRENSCDEAIILCARRVRMTASSLRELNHEQSGSKSGSETALSSQVSEREYIELLTLKLINL